ncbi:MAG: glycosyltransferase [Phycisphaeraceae bacterium]|nr:glycosyltransferase [Phycisphaeraceae bacterium]
MPGVSVLLPISKCRPSLARAFDAISSQTHVDLEILLLCDGLDPGDVAGVRDLAASDPRASVLAFERAGLGATLNAGALHARHNLLARMDDDDTCPPERFERQLQLLAESPSLAAAGCWWDIVNPNDATRLTMRPSADPSELRWRLLLGNCLAHGSMLIRRDVLAAVGGYDTSLPRSQDYDLWLRIGQAGWLIGVVPEVLYHYRLRSENDALCSSPEQAFLAARSMALAWRRLLPADLEALIRAMGSAMLEPRASLAMIEAQLRESPSVEGLLARLWHEHRFPSMERRAIEVCRVSRLREVGHELAARGVMCITLWGAGNHTRWVLDHVDALGVRVTGLVDDHCAGHERFGFIVRTPESLMPGETVVLSSDSMEDELWDRAALARARGVTIERIYADRRRG